MDVDVEGWHGTLLISQSGTDFILVHLYVELWVLMTYYVGRYSLVN